LLSSRGERLRRPEQKLEKGRSQPSFINLHRREIDMDFAANLGKLLLRLTLGGLVLFHGIAKIHNGVAPIVERVTGAGVPSALGYLVYVGEVLAPVLLIVGLWSRAAGLLVAINMTVAVLLVHTGQFGDLTKAGGWALELQAFYFFTAVAIVLLGAGKFSVGGTGGRWN
jgi:putative oxidoreductase